MPLRKMRDFLSTRSRNRETEDEKVARLEQAERDLGEFKARAHHLTKKLDERRKRNHWRESIEQMIQGA